jgi:prophage antirepressor-like protein
MSTKFRVSAALDQLLDDERVRKVELDAKTWFTAADVVAVLAETEHAAEFWEDLKHREPKLVRWVEPHHELGEIVDLEGIFRIVQSIDSPRAEKLKLWLADSARQRVEESQNPELTVIRTRRLYENRGYSRRWIDQRLRGVSTRHELTGEWYRRGARESDDFRTLTNELVKRSFGMDVEAYRRYKGLSRTGENLRDHMTDLELSLVTLAETVAVALHRSRNSDGTERLVADAHDAGEIVSQALREIENKGGRPVTFPGRHLDGTTQRETRHPRQAQTSKAA